MATGGDIDLRNEALKGCHFRDETGLECARIGHCRFKVLQQGTRALPYKDQTIKDRELELNEKDARNFGCKEL